MHLKPDDSEIMCGPSCRIIALSMILEQPLFTLILLCNKIPYALGKVHISVATAGDALTVTLECVVLERTVGFNACQCPFQTNVNGTFCSAQPKLIGHLEKLIRLMSHV